MPFAALAAAVLLSPAALPVRWVTKESKQAKAWSGSVKYPQFGGSSPLAAFANRQLAQEHEGALAEFLRDAKASIAEMGRPNPWWYEMQRTNQVALATPEIISVHGYIYSYGGGAHPNHQMPCRVYGLVGGKPARLTLQSLFRKGVDGSRIVSPIVIGQLMRAGASGIEDGRIIELDKDLREMFYVTPKGLQFVFEHYSVASYAEGAFDAFVPFSEIRSSLDPNGPLRSLLK